MEQFLNYTSPNVYHTPMTSSKYDGYIILTQPGVATTGRFLGFVAENPSASTRWVQVFDGYAHPSDGAVPIISIKLLTVTQGSFDAVLMGGLWFTTGCVIAVSSTGPTYTAVTAGASDGAFVTAFWV